MCENFLVFLYYILLGMSFVFVFFFYYLCLHFYIAVVVEFGSL
jgi:hypothetical protein